MEMSEVTFAHILDTNVSDSKPTVSNNSKSTIKQGSVDSTYEVKSSMKDLKAKYSGTTIKAVVKKKTGNLVVKSWIGKTLYKHLAGYFQYIPTSHTRFVKAKNIGGFKQILTKAGITLVVMEENY
jgi:hypothetical protein